MSISSRPIGAKPQRLKVRVNGKFFGAKLEGMPRVGREVLAAIDLLFEGRDIRDHFDFQVLVPENTPELPTYKHLTVRRIGPGGGPVWEQFVFPRHLDDGLALNFTGTGPVLTSRAVTVIHDAQMFSTPRAHGLKSLLLYGAITPIVGHRHRSIVTVSDYARHEILRFRVAREDRIHIIQNGADHVLRIKPDPDGLERFKLAPESYVLSNSYVHHHKNVGLLFDAFRHPLMAERQLVLYGTSGRSDFLARGLIPPANVRFLGRVSDRELRTLLEHARLFVFPSRTEGFGLPPLEAMTLGVPTIVSRSGAMPEICGDGAWYADPDASGQWVEAIDCLWDGGPIRRNLSKVGAQRATEFTWEKAARQYLDLLTDVSNSSVPY